jgi:hypothetical protein
VPGTRIVGVAPTEATYGRVGGDTMTEFGHNGPTLRDGSSGSGSLARLGDVSVLLLYKWVRGSGGGICWITSFYCHVFV